ncbi:MULTISPECIES: YcxB family protein [Luteimonas]|uniref:YcxB family protein n=1 Tax=Luteimonas TaxID=83614 RepID=UPI00117FC16F|nr:MULTISPECIES: YcxB family protein [Luteimonas]
MEHTAPKIDVAVRYQLREYKQVLRESIALRHTLPVTPPNRWWPWNWPVSQIAIFDVFVPVVFRWKMARVGDCAFTFSASGLSRTSRGHTASRTWDQVGVVHRLSCAYLIELEEGGAMPLPYRVFSSEQRRLFEAFAPRAG